MKVSQGGKIFIQLWEGFKEKAYLDGGGYSTIGYGHKFSASEDISQTISKNQALILFEKDIKEIEDTINQYVKAPLTQGQFDSIASLIFNWGRGRFIKSEGLEKLNRLDYVGAIEEFKEVDNIHGKESRGLHNRRLAEAELFNLNAANTQYL